MNSRKWIQRALSLALVATLSGGCHSDPNGHVLSVLNDSGQDVVIQLSADSSRTFVLPQHSYAGLSNGWDSIGTNWKVSVLGTDCRLIANLPIAQSGVLYIGDDHRVEWHTGLTASSTYATVASPAATSCT